MVSYDSSSFQDPFNTVYGGEDPTGTQNSSTTTTDDRSSSNDVSDSESDSSTKESTQTKSTSQNPKVTQNASVSFSTKQQSDDDRSVVDSHKESGALFESAANPALATSSGPSMYALLNAMGNLTNDKNKAVEKCLQDENVNLSAMNQNALDSANVQLSSAIQQKHDIQKALHKAEEQKTTNIIISACMIAATVLVMAAVIVCTGGLGTPAAIAFGCALVAQAISMTVTCTDLLSPDGPIKDSNVRLAVSIVILVALIALSVCGGWEALGESAAMLGETGLNVARAGLIIGATAGAVMQSNIIENSAAAIDQDINHASASEANKKAEDMMNSKTMQDVNYALLAVSLAACLLGLGVGIYGAGSTVDEAAEADQTTEAVEKGPTEVKQGEDGNETESARTNDISLNATTNEAEHTSEMAESDKESDMLASKSENTQAHIEGEDAPPSKASLTKTKTPEEKQAEIEKNTQRLHMFEQGRTIVESLSNMLQGSFNLYFQLSLAQTEKNIGEEQASSALFSSASEFFNSAASTVSKNMQQDMESMSSVSDMFNSLIKNVSSIQANIGIRS